VSSSTSQSKVVSLLERMNASRRRLATLCTRSAGLAGAALLLLLAGNVLARAAGLNPVWVSETSRVLFVWGSAVGMIAVSLAGQHFRVDLTNTVQSEKESPPGPWELVLQVGICAVLAYIAWAAAPSIARAATQPMASIPLTYGSLRIALVVALLGMLFAHLWRVAELVLAFGSARRQRAG
jgi:TRAP-type C4-dicarboxylate transport system permease small subunit